MLRHTVVNDNLFEQLKAIYKEFVSSKATEKKLQNCWQEVSLSEICNITYGKGLPTSELTEKGYPVYGGNGVIGYFSSYLYETERVIISCRGVASGKVLYSVPKSYVTSNSLVLNILNEDRIPFEFLLFSMLATDLSSKVTGSAQPQLTIDNIKDVPVLLPDADTIFQFKKIAKHLLLEISNNNSEAEILQQLQQQLLFNLSR